MNITVKKYDINMNITTLKFKNIYSIEKNNTDYIFKSQKGFTYKISIVNVLFMTIE